MIKDAFTMEVTVYLFVDLVLRSQPVRLAISFRPLCSIAFIRLIDHQLRKLHRVNELKLL